MRYVINTILLFFLPVIVFSQLPVLHTLKNEALQKQIQQLALDNAVSADSAWAVLSNWNNFAALENQGGQFLFELSDPVFGKVPMHVFVPVNYKPDRPFPMLLMLHGALGRSSFDQAYKRDDGNNEAFFFASWFQKQGFIVVRPFADVERKFDWVANRFNSGNANKTFNSLENAIEQLKQVWNVDDSKVFAFGFSDGADGAFALDVYKPSLFAGFVAYNSLFGQFYTRDIFLKNVVNRPLYIIHSDKDEIRPVQQTRAIVSVFDSLGAHVLYKEYSGYKHFDEHIEKDLPFSTAYLKGLGRNCFAGSVYWETADTSKGRCDWIRIEGLDTGMRKAKWHRSINPKAYSTVDNSFENRLYYGELQQSAAVSARYNHNMFEIETSDVKGVEIFISPAMVNMNDPVIVNVNGKELFNAKVAPDKNFLINQFLQHYDRQALWIASIKLEVKK